MADIKHGEEPLRDLKTRMDVFAVNHPEQVGAGMLLELTIFDTNRQSVTIGHVVGAGPSLEERTGLALAKLRAAIEEIDKVQGPQPGIKQMRERIEIWIATFEGRLN